MPKCLEHSYTLGNTQVHILYTYISKTNMYIAKIYVIKVELAIACWQYNYIGM